VRLLFVIHSLGLGGAERVTATLANHWAGQGWHVTIVTVDGETTDFYPLAPSVRRCRLALAGESRDSLHAVMANGRRAVALRRVLRAERPTVAVAIMPSANVLLALAARGLRIPTIGSERIHPPQLPLGRLWATARRFLYGRLDRVVAQTGTTRDWLAAHTALPIERIAVIGNPVSGPVARLGSDRAADVPVARPRGRRTLLAVGRLVRQKGFDRLIEAFATLAPQHPDWGLVILGEGPERGSLEALVRARGLSERVLLRGVVADVGAWYAECDLFALTSRFEGFPNTLLEAMAHGCAVVAMDCETGPREIVRDRIDGRLVAEGDQHSLVEALSALMGDAAERERLAEAAVAVRERFSLARIAGEWEALFDALAPAGVAGAGSGVYAVARDRHR